MNDANIKIQNMLGKPYAIKEGQSRKYVCWKFCREICSQLGISLPRQHHQQLNRIMVPRVPCIVLFRAAMDWHSGVVWPDGLHFIHTHPLDILNPDCTKYVVRKDRLTAWPYKLVIEGYYAAGNTKVVQYVTVKRKK